MSRESEPTPWDDIEALLDLVRVEEEVLLAVLEVLGELHDPDDDEFAWDEYALENFPPGEPPWGDLPMNVIHN
jgi:hypothetical protein